jgi:ribosomal protein L37AE/L43A
VKASDFLHCPECGKKGVTMRLGREDGWGCRYCEFWAYTSGEDRVDREARKALADLNPDHDIWVTDLKGAVDA